MRPVFIYTIRPRVPERLGFLSELAFNLWWVWHFDAIDLFRRIDRDQWDAVGQNPVRLLSVAGQSRLEQLAEDESFLLHLDRVEEAFRAYLSEPRWFQREFPEETNTQVAYFSMEYGLARCLPVYSGGLGVLSGDHLKTASDMGLPLVAVGLAYRQGYFRQYLNIDGWQQERYEENDFYNMPIEQVRDNEGKRLVVEVPYAGHGGGYGVKVYVWRVNVGRVPLYLLSTNLPENRPEDRQLTAQLYGGDRELRIRQEIVLGIGGLYVLRALGIEPNVFHMNEGHSAFLGLERLRSLQQERGLSLHEAYELVFTSNVFTTHTPVPAGNDVFEGELAQRYLQPLADDLGIGWDELLDYGRGQNGESSDLSMPVLALKTSAFNNGVSRLHASVSRGMWHSIWPDLPVDEVPIRPVTNGVHIYSWAAREIVEMYDRYIGPAWRNDPLGPELWRRVHEIPDEELWLTHSARRQRLVTFARQRLARQLQERGAPPNEVADAGDSLNPEALTIGFGRRFATYKRATLLFRDTQRLVRLLGQRHRPVQIIYAGKAHPKDDEGKKFIRQIIHSMRESGLHGSIMFLEDYDLEIARYMVQGCDVWLNNPRRPLEASGTSGMKAVLNGGLHCSTLDGWWAQAYSPELGWAIGAGEEYEDTAYQDEVEGEALYDLLEHEIIPLFWDRGPAQPPTNWIAKMKASMANLIPRFSSHRMLRNYIEEAYVPAAQRFGAMLDSEGQTARELANWRERVSNAWDGVHVERIEVRPGTLAGGAQLYVNEVVEARATVNLAGLSPEDVLVEAYSGVVDNQGNFQNAIGVPMEFESENEDGLPRFTGELASPQSGQFGLTVRVFPRHSALPSKHALFKVKWNQWKD
jgi:glycogen phosphorylase